MDSDVETRQRGDDPGRDSRLDEWADLLDASLPEDAGAA
jgi:hypothetical protein